ncbi:unnamed protein product [Cylindrotheca closterium]|uniref:Uncharacterized protein n=2 Tax=Cylindrotheca closterium TaxID=2856 RepID=A0AAD2CTK0_9STRA|nr:unnamed protein product [Cylindrotheca closterium]
MRGYNELHYPNLVGCRVKLTGSVAAANGSAAAPVSLPKEVFDAARIAIPATPYDFTLEKEILQKKATATDESS